MSSEFAQIDWSRPWYEAVRPAYEALGLEGTDFAGAFNRQAAQLALRNHRDLPITFVPQESLPEGMAYEEFISATGNVPTRENLHDFFNGLVWQTFPAIKRELNALQAAQIEAFGGSKARGPARDAATIFDENAALLIVRASSAGRELVDELRAHCWDAALFEKRAMFGPDAQLWLFGHALMEKLVAPRKAITAHVRVVFAPDDYFGFDAHAQRAWIDDTVAQTLRAEGLSTSGFTPLPVLGVPGWWPGQDQAFYLDTGVFRPKRAS
ncbi:DUF3025 domain-containing protein [Massilia sp. Mn16-1_5]|uniref:DUF3025 domain-containing protein n=1 Tax=Massilia sp. Mn16-1_5 TaxID=2079199 RepID=UPI00109E42BB|nr:DUF3025 domain-containing protein [Massilia sp. Mn16-1_5]THC41136.1 DUF3025 domain-containing protein [Massilia sp. Mn16-1_5]